MFRYVIAYLIAGVLRPLVPAALAVLAIAFVITVPARLWILFVDPRASAQTIAVLNWTMGLLLAALGASRWVLPDPGRVMRHVRRRRPTQHAA